MKYLGPKTDAANVATQEDVDVNTLLSGSGAPSSGLGDDGDFYVDTAVPAIYGPKTAGSWGSATSLVGPQGEAGANGTNGTNGTNGSDGSFALAQTIDNKTAAYTLVNGDKGKAITVDSASAVNVTINNSLGLSTGERVDVIQTGAGQLTFVASSTTVNGTPGLKTRAQYSGATVLCTGSNTYIVIGDLAA